MSKFAKMASVEITVRHLVHLFVPNFYLGTMLNLRHREGKSLVVRMDDKSSRQFWLDFFFVKIEVVVDDVISFPEAWNRTRKYLYFAFTFLNSRVL